MLQLRPGHIFNIGAGKQALKNLNALALFSNIEVNPCPDETKEGGVLVEIKLNEQDHKSVDVTTEWNIVPGPGGRPTLVMCLHICNLLIFIISVSKIAGQAHDKL